MIEASLLLSFLGGLTLGWVRLGPRRCGSLRVEARDVNGSDLEWMDLYPLHPSSMNHPIHVRSIRHLRIKRMDRVING